MSAPAPLPIEFQPWKTQSRYGTPGDDQWIYRFPNGYGASVVRGPYTYGGPEGLLEVGVIAFSGNSWQLTYETPVTSDVLGWQSVEEVAALLVAIAGLPAQEVADV